MMFNWMDRRADSFAGARLRDCGGSKLSKVGEDITETLDVVPRQLTPQRGGVPIPGEAARYSGMMPPTHSEMMSPTVPR